jgi:cytosine/adenosine deaminase-related metal-dependent hydrolase/SAM-dependent methyltransferase
MSLIRDITDSSPEAPTRNRRAFDAWAAVYDAQANPLLALEERYLKRLLPEVKGRTVLDAGCGSGRWLSYLADRGPTSLTGVDPSIEMLRAAAGKGASADLFAASCDEMPFSPESFDLILSSFVLSYVDDLSRCAVEMHRVARPGSDLFFSDMHPETRRTLGWKRSFRIGDRKVELDAHSFSVDDIVAAFTQVGWSLRTALSPEFGTSERVLFEQSGGMPNYQTAQGHPAIYILQFYKPAGIELPPSRDNFAFVLPDTIVLRGASCAMGPSESQPATCVVVNAHIESITDDRIHRLLANPADRVDIDLSGYLLLPGLINAHDHLEFALFPRLRTRHYQNATEWADDIHKSHAGVIALHRTIPKRTRLLWGGLRNLLCGATTVCHHNPLLPELESDDFPVHVVRRYGWGHSLTFSRDLKAEHDATPADFPFLVHACEGIDGVAHDELMALDRMGILNSRTILIHGLALNVKDAELLRSRGVSLILCPSSNHFLFGEVPSADILEKVDAIALGSDSPLTACGDILDEIRFAAQHCGLSARRLYSMVTASPAGMLRLPDDTASLRASAPCDAIAVRDRGLQPDETLCSLSSADIELVLRNGQVFLASEEMLGRLPEGARRGLQPLSIAGTVRWLRAPVGEMLREAEAVLGKDQVRLGGKQVLAVDATSEYVRSTPSKELIHAR